MAASGNTERQLNSGFSIPEYPLLTSLARFPESDISQYSPELIVRNILPDYWRKNTLRNQRKKSATDRTVHSILEKQFRNGIAGRMPAVFNAASYKDAGSGTADWSR